VGNDDEGKMSKTITNGFNRWDFKSAICRAPFLIDFSLLQFGLL